jgi:DNA repair protein RecO (recombination protein O)
MGYQQSEGIVLRTYPLNDGDKVAVVLTKDFGVVRGFAKGARKLKSKFGSSLEPLTVAQFNFFLKEHHETVRLDKAELQQSYFNAASKDSTLELITYWTELILEFLPPYMPEERVYRMLKACLKVLTDNPDNFQTITCYFEVWLLKLAGFFPDLSKCKGCNRLVSKKNVSVINTTGILCVECADSSSRPHSTLYTLLSRIHKLPPSGFAHEKFTEPEQKEELIELVRSLVKEAIEERYSRLNSR